ncbi:hypothetical protein CHS0354_018962 [Potamilus streckersoni]|uniref:F-box domain-containing protein n=1 Tax=Potamilus streckersoni TaxID=2493646 RepID=A0AAE0T6H5_9BIVA|nr:hypothetical protein CHS0354_018962 [Potamilus streckersoni]
MVVHSVAYDFHCGSWMADRRSGLRCHNIGLRYQPHKSKRHHLPRKSQSLRNLKTTKQLRTHQRRLNIGRRYQPRKTSRHQLPRKEIQQNQDQPQLEPRRSSVYNSTSFPFFSKQNADNELVAENAMLRKSQSLPNLKTTEQSRTRQRQLSLHFPHGGDSEDATGPPPVEELRTRGSRLTLASVSYSDSLNALALLTPHPPSAPSRNLQTVRAARKSGNNSEKNMSFSFQLLPYICQLEVFSYLSSLEKGRLFLVCKCWYDLLRSCYLWSHVSCSEIQMHCVTKEQHNCLEVCYARYCQRVHQFLDFLGDIHPVLHSLKFKFDIADTKDGHLLKLEQFIANANMYNLKYVSMNWNSTPVRPFCLEKSPTCAEIFKKDRERRCLFVDFFSHFTLFTPNITTLIFQFDWSERTVESLLRLKQLCRLDLEENVINPTVSQTLLDKLLSGLLNLKKLMLQVWIPFGQGFVMFSITSRSLEYLDVSQCRGFYIKHINTPNLTQFRVSRHPWEESLFFRNQRNIPCLYDILLEGAPDLVKLNDHYLKNNWKEIKYNQLQEILKGFCSCRQHKTERAL